MAKISVIKSTRVLLDKFKKLLNDIGITEIEIVKDRFLDLKKLEHRFDDSDIILMDTDYSEIDVLKVIRKLKNHPNKNQTPIIVLTGQSNIKYLKTLITAGCTDFILKPFLDETFYEKILKWVPEYRDTKPEISEDESLDIAYFQLRWNAAYAIGVERIDLEHKSIVDSYEELYNLMKLGKGHEYYQQLLMFLEGYVNTHFDNEERFQASIGYDGLEEHRELHENFKNQVYKMIQDHKGGEITNMDLIKISIFIKDWLIHHILMEDMAYANLIQDQ